MADDTAIRDERAQFSLPDFSEDASALAPAAEPITPAKITPRKTAIRIALRRLQPLLALHEIAGLAEREWARGTGFLWFPVLLGFGALIYFVVPFEPPAYAIFIGGAALAITAFLARRHFIISLGVFAATTVVLGFGAGKFETWRADTQMLGSDITTRITGRVVRVEQRGAGRFRLTVDVLETARPRLKYAPRRVRLTARNIPAGLGPGDGVHGLARLMSPSGPVRPLAYDFSFESYFDGIGAVGFFMRNPERVELVAPAGQFLRLKTSIERFRQILAARLREKIQGPEGEVAVALIAGVRGGIPDEISESLRRAGLAHVLAISGLHMALVAFTLMGATRFVFALFPGFSARYPVKKYAAAGALVACAFYLLISGAAVAAQRSFIMLAVMLLALLFDRAALTMRNLAIAAIAVLIVSPHEIVGPGFQMSFAATAALIAGYAAWNRRREKKLSVRAVVPMSRAGQMLRLAILYCGGLALTSLIAGAATALYGAWHFQRASPLSLGANLVAMPIVSIAVMPSAVLAALAMPFNLDGWPLAVMGKGIAAVIAVARWFSERTPLDATGIIPLPVILLGTAALVFLTLTTTRLRLVAIPILIVGGALLWGRETPDVLISEDARLVAMPMEDGRVAVNRARPNGFTMDNWARALRADAVVKPNDGPAGAMLPDDGEHGFYCQNGTCLARQAGGAVIAHVSPLKEEEDKRAYNARIRQLCRESHLLIVNDPTIRVQCGNDEAHMITSKDLARRGSARVQFVARHRDTDVKARSIVADIAFAMQEPWRPWHAYRQYSRAARGLGPYKRDKKKSDANAR